MAHFLRSCDALHHIRKPLLATRMDDIPYVYHDHPATWEENMTAQLILDSSHPTVLQILPEIEPLLPLIDKHTLILTFALHRTRSKILEEKSSINSSVSRKIGKTN